MSTTTNSSILIPNNLRSHAEPDRRSNRNAAQVQESVPQLFTVRAMGLVSFFSGGLATAAMGVINELRLNHPHRTVRIAGWIGLFASLQLAFLAIATLANLPSHLCLGWYGFMSFLAQTAARRQFADAYQQMEGQGVSGITWLYGMAILLGAFAVNVFILIGIVFLQGDLSSTMFS